MHTEQALWNKYSAKHDGVYLVNGMTGYKASTDSYTYKIVIHYKAYWDSKHGKVHVHMRSPACP